MLSFCLHRLSASRDVPLSIHLPCDTKEAISTWFLQMGDGPQARQIFSPRPPDHPSSTGRLLPTLRVPTVYLGCQASGRAEAPDRPRWYQHFVAWAGREVRFTLIDDRRVDSCGPSFLFLWVFEWGFPCIYPVLGSCAILGSWLMTAWFGVWVLGGDVFVVRICRCGCPSLGIWDEGMQGAGCCLLYTSPSPRDGLLSRMPSSA